MRPDWLEGIGGPALVGIDPALFERVREAYDTPGRFYHSWGHVLTCLDEYRSTTFDEPRAVLLALLFHDAVYVAGRNDNEAKSAELAERTIAELSEVPADERGRIAQMILLTASHHAVSAPSPDAMRMLDIDLAILGADWPVYKSYADGVRREFCPAVTSEFRFRIGRRRFLRGLLEQPHIFLTDAMRARRERAARENIVREISDLEQEMGIAGRVVAGLT
jgi:predicted metal-dependent HD superfamily phosphohydrolase